MTNYTSDVAIAGGGIIGLAIAYKLAKSGLHVIVVDDSRQGQASAAAAGMLAPLAESNSIPNLVTIGIPSLRLYPKYLEELSETSGISLKLSGPGIIRTALTEEEAIVLCNSLSRHENLKVPGYKLTPEEALKLEPLLTPNIVAAVLSPEEKHIQPVLLMDALTQACIRLNVEIIKTTEALKIAQSGITTSSGRITSGSTIIANGIWSRDLLNDLGYHAPLTPVKGHIATVRMQSEPVPSHTIYAHSTYIVPRNNGDILTGATEEPQDDYNAEVNEQTIDMLIERACHLSPSLQKATKIKGQAGLRPVCSDRLPIIGKVPGYDNIYMAVGHGRNGILLTPVTAQYMHDLIIDHINPPSTVDPTRIFIEIPL